MMMKGIAVMAAIIATMNIFPKSILYYFNDTKRDTDVVVLQDLKTQCVCQQVATIK